MASVRRVRSDIALSTPSREMRAPGRRVATVIRTRYAHHLSPESGPACDVGAGTIIAPYKDQAALKDRAGLSKAKWSRRRSLSCGIPRIKWSAGCSGQDRQIFSRGGWISKRLAGFGELLVNPTSDTAGIKICVELR